MLALLHWWGAQLAPWVPAARALLGSPGCACWPGCAFAPALRPSLFAPRSSYWAAVCAVRVG
eukprot:3344319-Alexandrium_andersonii.AAC.1